MINKLVLLNLIFLSCSKTVSIDKVYFNGQIWTGDYNNPYATSIFIRDSIIIFVGSDEESLAMSGKNTVKIDLKDKFVTPGLIDNHVHFISGGLQLSRVDLSNVRTMLDFKKKIIKTHKELPLDKWMQGGNWDHEKWGGEYPDKAWIDDIVPDRPVILERLDGHMALANSFALRLAGIDRGTKDPAGGLIVKDDNGYPTGILKDKAINLCTDLIPEETDEELDKALERASDHALSLGVTQVHDMGLLRDLEVYRRNYKNSNLRIRIKLFTWYTNWEDIVDYVKKNGVGNDWLKWNGIKGMVDGSLGSRTAWMYEPYLDDYHSYSKELLPTVGIITLKDTTDFKYILRETDKNNIQHAVHAIGDKANDWILNQFSEIRIENGE